MKKIVARKPEAEEVEKAKFEIAELQCKDKPTEVDLYYFGESGFSLTTSVSYGWQDIGKRIEWPGSGRFSINVAGFLNPITRYSGFFNMRLKNNLNSLFIKK